MSKERVLYTGNMTQTVAIPCKDRIIVCADGKAFDIESQAHTYNTSKLYQLNGNICVSIAGNNLYNPPKFMELIKIHTRDLQENGHEIEIDLVTEFIQMFAESETWRGTDTSLAFIRFTISGYKNGIPRIKVIENMREYSGGADYYSDGIWVEGFEYIADKLAARTYREIEAEEAEIIATKVILEAERFAPTMVGGQQQMWHIKPHCIEKKSKSYIEVCRKKANLR